MVISHGLNICWEVPYMKVDCYFDFLQFDTSIKDGVLWIISLLMKSTIFTSWWCKDWNFHIVQEENVCVNFRDGDSLSKYVFQRLLILPFALFKFFMKYIKIKRKIDLKEIMDETLSLLIFNGVTMLCSWQMLCGIL